MGTVWEQVVNSEHDRDLSAADEKSGEEPRHYHFIIICKRDGKSTHCTRRTTIKSKRKQATVLKYH